MLSGSPVEPFVFEGVSFWLKRDDLLNHEIDGNKARKFYSLMQNTPADIDTIVSYGGNQSNAMYSLSALAKRKKLRFIYFTKKLSNQAKESGGNLKFALENSMELSELDDTEYDKIALGMYEPNKNEMFIPQGGACEMAREGLHKLADELNDFCAKKEFKNPKAILSSGTGTSAAYLSERFYGEVLTMPCVGTKEYLQEQMSRLISTDRLPTIMETTQKYHFAKPHADIWNMHQKLLRQGVEFDLLYDSVTWIAIGENIEKLSGGESFFIHSGGIRGNETQIERYRYKKLIL